jgi:hypothetical protein
MKGAVAKRKVANNNILRLPKISEREAAGRLMRIPGTVEAPATRPSKSSGVPKLAANGFKTGFFDIVELNMAKEPTTHIVKK